MTWKTAISGLQRLPRAIRAHGKKLHSKKLKIHP
jgi:hypothetical protein